MKKLTFSALAFCGALTLALTACSPKEPAATPTPEATETPIVETTEPIPTSEPSLQPQPTESINIVTPPAETDAVVKPLETQTPVQTQPNQTPAPAPTPTESPSETPTQDSKVQAVWSVIEGWDLPSFQDLDDDLLSDFYGVDPADLVEYVCKIPFMNTRATEFFIAQVQPGRLDAVKSALEQRQADLEAQWSQYLPDQLELVQNYQLVTNGDYILFAVSERAGDAVNEFNTYTK